MEWSDNMEKFLYVLAGGLILFMILGQVWAFVIFFLGIIILSYVANSPDK